MSHPAKEDRKFKRKLFSVLESEGCTITKTANSHYKVRVPTGGSVMLASLWLSKPFEKKIRKKFAEKGITFGKL